MLVNNSTHTKQTGTCANYEAALVEDSDKGGVVIQLPVQQVLPGRPVMHRSCSQVVQSVRRVWMA